MSEPAPVLRRMRWWDVEAVHALEVQLFDPDTWSPETFWAELAAAGRYYVLAETDVVAANDVAAHDVPVEVLGYAGLAVSGADADIQTVAVSPSAQGRGVGAALLRALVEEAAQRGASAVLLEVRADNLPARALYERFGFERIAVRRRYYQPGGIDAHVMRLRPLRSREVPPAREPSLG